MKTQSYYSLNKSERALQILCYYGASAVVLPYINLRHTFWDGTCIRMEFGSAVIVFEPPTAFDVKDFLESVREHWLFELREGGGLKIDVYLAQMSLEG